MQQGKGFRIVCLKNTPQHYCTLGDAREERSTGGTLTGYLSERFKRNANSAINPSIAYLSALIQDEKGKGRGERRQIEKEIEIKKQKQRERCSSNDKQRQQPKQGENTTDRMASIQQFSHRKKEQLHNNNTAMPHLVGADADVSPNARPRPKLKLKMNADAALLESVYRDRLREKRQLLVRQSQNRSMLKMDFQNFLQSKCKSEHPPPVGQDSKLMKLAITKKEVSQAKQKEKQKQKEKGPRSISHVNPEHHDQLEVSPIKGRREVRRPLPLPLPSNKYLRKRAERDMYESHMMRKTFLQLTNFDWSKVGEGQM